MVLEHEISVQLSMATECESVLPLPPMLARHWRCRQALSETLSGAWLARADDFALPFQIAYLPIHHAASMKFGRLDLNAFLLVSSGLVPRTTPRDRLCGSEQAKPVSKYR